MYRLLNCADKATTLQTDATLPITVVIMISSNAEHHQQQR
jgi:hypothetical protein